MRAGPLDRLITIEQKTTVTGPAGGETFTWTELAKVFARKSDQRAQEFFTGQQHRSKRETSFRIRWRSDVTDQMRVVFDTVEYNIQGILEIGRHDGLELMCFADNP